MTRFYSVVVSCFLREIRVSLPLSVKCEIINASVIIEPETRFSVYNRLFVTMKSDGVIVIYLCAMHKICHYCKV